MSLIGRFLRESQPEPVPLEYFLRGQEVPFSIHHHPPVFSAQRLAREEHVPGKMVAKVVIAWADEQMVMLCIPAPCRINMLRLMELLCTDNVRLASEAEFARAFPDCEVGAMPPFGRLYRMPVFVDKQLAEDDRILFPAGTHRDTAEMAYADFARLARPVVADVCSPT